MDFTTLHHQDTPLLIANVWDACSAIAAQQAGYLALGTSSAAIAAMLGYEDGEGMPFEELLFIIKRIKSVSDLPLSVDIEAGFGETVSQIADNLIRLADLGVVGVNLEDSKVINGIRKIENAELFSDNLKQIRRILSGQAIQLFINVRTDTFLLNLDNALQDTLYRGHLYHQAGADGLFVPCVTKEQDIENISTEIALPLNVMCMPELADFAILARLGVRRISMGNFFHAQIQQELNRLMTVIQSRRSFAGIFCHESH